MEDNTPFWHDQYLSPTAAQNLSSHSASFCSSMLFEELFRNISFLHGFLASEIHSCEEVGVLIRRMLLLELACVVVLPCLWMSTCALEIRCCPPSIFLTGNIETITRIPCVVIPLWEFSQHFRRNASTLSRPGTNDPIHKNTGRTTRLLCSLGARSPSARALLLVLTITCWNSGSKIQSDFLTPSPEKTPPKTPPILIARIPKGWSLGLIEIRSFQF